jgi:hypothetical protein
MASPVPLIFQTMGVHDLPSFLSEPEPALDSNSNHVKHWAEAFNFRDAYLGSLMQETFIRYFRELSS